MSWACRARWLDYEPVKGEIVQDIGIYRYEAGKSDHELQRDQDIEDSLRPDSWSCGGRKQVGDGRRGPGARSLGAGLLPDSRQRSEACV